MVSGEIREITATYGLCGAPWTEPVVTSAKAVQLAQADGAKPTSEKDAAAVGASV